MAYGLTNSEHYEDIASAIRTKNGKTDTYKPGEMADAILELTGSESGYPVMEVPEAYLEYVEYARENLFTEDYKDLVVWDSGEWIAVSFLMDDFEIEEYDLYSTEVKATGWFTCGYTKSDGTWTDHDYRDSVSPGGNYARYIKFASCPIMYGDQILFPVGVTDTIKINSIDYDDDAGTVTIKYATGQTEVLTWVKDADGNITGVTDSQGHTTTLAGVSA